MTVETISPPISTTSEQRSLSASKEWREATIGEITSKVGSGITPTGGNAVYIGFGTPFVRSQNIGWGKLILDDLAFISREIHETFSSTELHEHDILLNITGASIGRCAIADTNIFGGNVNQHVCVIRVDHGEYSAKFVGYVLLSEIGQNQINSFQAGGNRQGLNFAQVRSIACPIPPRVDQDAIAAALSDADGLIEALESLIAKKRAVKQGTMQDLLSARTRLPGFTGEWQLKRLGEISAMKSGNTIVTEYIDHYSRFPCYGGNGLRGYTSKFTHDGDHALIGRQGALCGNVYYVRGQFFASEHAIVVAAKSCTEIRWLTHSLIGMNLNQYSEASAQPGLSVEKVLKLELVVPPTRREQQAIAAILSDMDDELATIESRLAKARVIKQGMMQELLTGRIRLV